MQRNDTLQGHTLASPLESLPGWAILVGMIERPVSVEQYLDRIGVRIAPEVSLDGLTTLQQAHLASVPFENIDVFRQTGVRTDLAWSIPKIVSNKRGGWCFENNGAFAWLLGELGFNVTLLGAFVLLPPADTENMTHLCLQVDLDEPYLVDVGFGDSFLQPLPLSPDTTINDGNATYRLVQDGEYLVLHEYGKTLRPLYQFTLKPRRLEDFEEASVLLQTPGRSNFTANPFATRTLEDGPDRVTLLSDRLKFRRGGEWSEEPVALDEWDATAHRWFGLEL
jgi:N-hydroxyarylamine O-acetyltransferase